MRGALLSVAAALVLLSACNALTGAADLTVSDGPSDARVVSPDVATGIDGGGATDSGPVDVLDAEPFEDVTDASPVTDAGPDADAAVPCTLVTVGPRRGSDTSTTDLGNPNWSDGDGILAPDHIRTHTNGEGDGTSNPNTLTITGFGFALPSAAVIKGIRVEVERNAIGSVVDDSLALPKGTPKKGLVWPEGNFEGPYVKQAYGSAADLWGTSWTADDFNSPNFAVHLKVSGDGDGHADALGVSVSYCVPGD